MSSLLYDERNICCACKTICIGDDRVPFKREGRDYVRCRACQDKYDAYWKETLAKGEADRKKRAACSWRTWKVETDAGFVTVTVGVMDTPAAMACLRQEVEAIAYEMVAADMSKFRKQSL